MQTGVRTQIMLIQLAEWKCSAKRDLCSGAGFFCSSIRPGHSSPKKKWLGIDRRQFGGCREIWCSEQRPDWKADYAHFKVARHATWRWTCCCL